MKHQYLAGALFVVLGIGFAQQAAGEFRDVSHGFRISPPVFPVSADVRNHLVAQFHAPEKDGFSSNVNIQVQAPKMSLTEYISLSRAQFSTAGFEVLEEKRLSVSGHNAVQWTYTGTFPGGKVGSGAPVDRRLKFLAWAIERGEQVILITCTAPLAAFAEYEPGFRASLESFAFTGSQ